VDNVQTLLPFGNKVKCINPWQTGKVAHRTPLAAGAIHSHPNYGLLFGGIRIQRLKVMLSLRSVDTEQAFGPEIWWLTP
jgi:hypothetical protein